MGLRSPYCGDLWRRYCCFFPIVDTCLSCEDTAQQSCAMVPRWQMFGDFLCPVFSVSRVQHISDLHSKFLLRPHPVVCGSMVDIQSATTEIRRGKMKERKKTDRRNDKRKVFHWAAIKRPTRYRYAKPPRKLTT